MVALRLRLSARSPSNRADDARDQAGTVILIVCGMLKFGSAASITYRGPFIDTIPGPGRADPVQSGGRLTPRKPLGEWPRRRRHRSPHIQGRSCPDPT